MRPSSVRVIICWILLFIYPCTNVLFANGFIGISLPSHFARQSNRPAIRPAWLAYGTVQKTLNTQTPNTQTIIHIQDIHANFEAQQNIGKAIAALLRDNQASIVALEGAFGTIDLSRYQNLPQRDAVTKAADYLLKENKISGAIHACLTASSSHVKIVGIDDLAHYRRHVQSVRDAERRRAAVQKRLAQTRQQLALEKEAVFHAALRKFDAQAAAYHDGRLSMGRYAQILKSHLGRLPPSGETFAHAIRRENQIDFKRVESERTQLLNLLLTKLTRSQTDELLRQTRSYRAGKISHANYHTVLTNLAAPNGIAIAHYPALLNYLAYARLSEQIDPETLLRELQWSEGKTYAALTRSRRQQKLIRTERRVRLTEKFVNFALTREEWNAYRRDEVSSPPAMQPFERFYEEAEVRDKKMTAHLLREMGRGNPVPTVILVTGGFHSAGIDRRLADAGYTVQTFVPNVTKIGDDKAPIYLSAFSREKTPLDRLFDGRKLFLATRPDAGVDAALPILVSAMVGGTPLPAHGFHIDAAPTAAYPNSVIATEVISGRRARVSVVDTSDGIRVIYQTFGISVILLLAGQMILQHFFGFEFNITALRDSPIVQTILGSGAWMASIAAIATLLIGFTIGNASVVGMILLLMGGIQLANDNEDRPTITIGSATWKTTPEAFSFIKTLSLSGEPFVHAEMIKDLQMGSDSERTRRLDALVRTYPLWFAENLDNNLFDPIRESVQNAVKRYLIDAAKNQFSSASTLQLTDAFEIWICFATFLALKIADPVITVRGKSIGIYRELLGIALWKLRQFPLMENKSPREIFTHHLMHTSAGIKSDTSAQLAIGSMIYALSSDVQWQKWVRIGDLAMDEKPRFDLSTAVTPTSAAGDPVEKTEAWTNPFIYTARLTNRINVTGGEEFKKPPVAVISIPNMVASEDERFEDKKNYRRAQVELLYHLGREGYHHWSIVNYTNVLAPLHRWFEAEQRPHDDLAERLTTYVNNDTSTSLSAVLEIKGMTKDTQIDQTLAFWESLQRNASLLKKIGHPITISIYEELKTPIQPTVLHPLEQRLYAKENIALLGSLISNEVAVGEKILIRHEPAATENDGSSMEKLIGAVTKELRRHSTPPGRHKTVAVRLSESLDSSFDKLSLLSDYERARKVTHVLLVTDEEDNGREPYAPPTKNDGGHRPSDPSSPVLDPTPYLVTAASILIVITTALTYRSNPLLLTFLLGSLIAAKTLGANSLQSAGENLRIASRMTNKGIVPMEHEADWNLDQSTIQPATGPVKWNNQAAAFTEKSA